MKKLYTASGHNVTKALAESEVTFPISKAELIKKAGDKTIQLDFDRSIQLKEYVAEIKLDEFENKSQFFNALMAANIEL